MRAVIENLFALAGIVLVLGSMHVSYSEIVYRKPEKPVIYKAKIIRDTVTTSKYSTPVQKMRPMPYWWDLDRDTIEINRGVSL